MKPRRSKNNYVLPNEVYLFPILYELSVLQELLKKKLFPVGLRDKVH